MSNLTRADVEQVVDYALTLAKAGAAKTHWQWDDKLVSWAIAGKDGLVTMVCRMFGISTGTSPIVFLPHHAAPVTTSSLGIDTPEMAGMTPEKTRLLQFVLNLLVFLRRVAKGWQGDAHGAIHAPVKSNRHSVAMQLRVDFANISCDGPLTYPLQLFQKGVHVKRLGAELPGKKGDHFLPFALAEQRLAQSRFAG